MGSLQGVLGRALYQFLLLYACEEGTQSWMLLELGGHFLKLLLLLLLLLEYSDILRVILAINK